MQEIWGRDKKAGKKEETELAFQIDGEKNFSSRLHKTISDVIIERKTTRSGKLLSAEC